MHKLTIRTQNKSNTTTIENEFIDTYMPSANGEFIKVYLYLLRHLNTEDFCITLTHMADCLNNTERDILRALKYWEKEGLLIIAYNQQGLVCGIDIATISVDNVGAAKNTQMPATAAPSEVPSTPKIPAIQPKTNTSKSRKEFKQLLFMAEQYLGKTLSKSDVDMIAYFYDTLHFPISLVEYLIEYCVENGHHSMHYIQSVALAWSDQNILTVEGAKAQISNFNKDFYTILKAFGITNRSPVTSEKQFINKWKQEYGFTMELILEACNRTIGNIHQPSFEYADSILRSWIEKQVHYVSDLDKLDKTFQDSKTKSATKKQTTNKAQASNSFNNFEQRAYDIDSLEMQLLNAK